MDRAAIYAFINRQRYGVVSSTASSGTPQSALVGIASTSRLEVIFDTVKSSRKYPNLIQRPACSLVIGWSGEQTLQLEGIAEEPQGAALRELQDVLLCPVAEGTGAYGLARNCLLRRSPALDTLQRLRPTSPTHPGTLKGSLGVRSLTVGCPRPFHPTQMGPCQSRCRRRNLSST